MANNRTTVRKTPRGQSVGEALPKLAKMLSRRGLEIVEERDVPLFRSDLHQHGVLIRLLNGRETAGRIDAKGVFRPLRNNKHAAAH